MSNQQIETTVYLQITKDIRRSWANEGKVVRHTSKKPDITAPGAVVVKIKVRLPKAAFDHLTPSAVIEVPEELVQHPVEVVAEPAS